MYKSLTFYYSNSCLDEGLMDQTLNLNVPGQLEISGQWLEREHLQHQQWVATLTFDYETSYQYETQAFVSSKSSPSLVDIVDLDYTMGPLTFSKLFYSQLSYSNRSLFPGLLNRFSGLLTFQPFDHTRLSLSPSNSEGSGHLPLNQLLPKFVAWFKFSKLYLSFHLRKVNLEEDGRISETFSNRLLCHWLATQPLTAISELVYAPFMEPTKVGLYKHLTKMKESIQRMKAMSQFALICKLNSLISDWTSLWSLYIRYSSLRYCEAGLKRLLQRWSKRRHPNKGWGWVCHKYWRGSPSAKKYVFWLRILSNLCTYSNNARHFFPKRNLVNLCQMTLDDCIRLETTPFIDWQFFCSDSKETLIPYTLIPLKKWRKSRSFDYFLLY